MRNAVFAGSFYPKQENALRLALENCFAGIKGPGALPSRQSGSGRHLRAVVAPHASLQFGGQASAWSFKAIAEAGLPDLFIILAPNHYSPFSGIGIDTMKTPLGEVRVDQEFARALAAKGSIPVNDSIHLPEHSIEVQLPLLQFALHDRIERLKIVPILLSSDLDLAKAAIDIKETLIDLKRSATFIVSTDFTHYGRNYHYMPFYKDVRDSLAELDGKAISFVKSLDLKGFEAFADESQINICGYNCLRLLLRLLRQGEGLLEQYYSSGDVNGDFKNCVSYASIVFK